MDRTEFADLATDLAAELGKLRHETWTAELDGPGSTYGVLTGPGHARLGLSWSFRENKLTVRGHYPEGTGGTAYQARVDPERGLTAISKDINRRVLEAGYLPVLARQVERKAAQDKTAAERAAWLGKAAALFGIEPPSAADDIGRGIKPRLDLSQFVAGQGHAESYWDGADRLDIGLTGIPAQVALDMLKVLAESDAVRARCCFTYGPEHPPQFSVAGCLYPGRPDREGGEDASRVRVYGFLTRSRGLAKDAVVMAMDEARASRYQVSEIYDGERGPGARLLAIVSWNHEGCGEYTVQVPREAS